MRGLSPQPTYLAFKIEKLTDQRRCQRAAPDRSVTKMLLFFDGYNQVLLLILFQSLN